MEGARTPLTLRIPHAGALDVIDELRSRRPLLVTSTLTAEAPAALASRLTFVALDLSLFEGVATFRFSGVDHDGCCELLRRRIAVRAAANAASERCQRIRDPTSEGERNY